MRLKFWAAASLIALASACATAPKAPSPEAAAQKIAPKAQLGAFGLETQYIKAAVKPGDDFFDYVNGGWVDANEIPASPPAQN